MLFKMVQDGTFGVTPASSRMDVQVAGEFASCCGVNLAFAALGVWFFFPQVLKSCPDTGFRGHSLDRANFIGLPLTVRRR